MSEAPLRQRMLKFNNWVEIAILSTLDKKIEEEYWEMQQALHEDPNLKAKSLLVKELSRADVERIFKSECSAVTGPLDLKHSSEFVWLRFFNGWQSFEQDVLHEPGATSPPE
jgi:hypothetical protein